MVKNLGGFYPTKNSQKSLSFTPNDGENPGTLPYSMDFSCQICPSVPKQRTSKKNGEKDMDPIFLNDFL